MERVKAITEDFLRVELRNTQPEVYYIPEGKILTPAAREYLQQRKIKVAAGGQPGGAGPRGPPRPPAVVPTVMCAPEPPKPKYVDYETGAYYMEKPEHMTQLFGNVLVAKDHPRIHFRGKLDSLQALVVLDQVQIAEGGCQKLVDDLGNILGVLREMMRCDVLDEAFKNETIIVSPTPSCGSVPTIRRSSSACSTCSCPITPWAGIMRCSTSSAPPSVRRR